MVIITNKTHSPDAKVGAAMLHRLNGPELLRNNGSVDGEPGIGKSAPDYLDMLVIACLEVHAYRATGD